MGYVESTGECDSLRAFQTVTLNPIAITPRNTTLASREKCFEQPRDNSTTNRCPSRAKVKYHVTRLRDQHFERDEIWGSLLKMKNALHTKVIQQL